MAKVFLMLYSLLNNITYFGHINIWDKIQIYWGLAVPIGLTPLNRVQSSRATLGTFHECTYKNLRRLPIPKKMAKKITNFVKFAFPQMPPINRDDICYIATTVTVV